jgi:outer membrane autotransporter protein
MDIYRPSKDSVIGITIGRAEHDTKQLSDKVEIEEFTLGLYGGLFKEKWSLNGYLGAGYQEYEGKRKIEFLGRDTKSDYEGYSVLLDIETGYKSHLKGATVLRPFIGLGMGYVRTESFNEDGADGANLHAENYDYLRTEVRIGANLNNGKKNRFNWYAEAAGRVLLTGDKGEYRAQFQNTQRDMKIRGSKQEKAHISLGAGAEYEIAENVSLYVNFRAQESNTSKGYYGNSGISFRF